MKVLAGVAAVLLFAACATMGTGGSGGRRELWEWAHEAMARDSFRVAEAFFQRLAREHPRTHEGHEAHFYLGVLNLEPRGGVDLRAADEHLRTYISEDPQYRLYGYHHREAESLLQLTRLMLTPCEQRNPPLGCQTVTRVETRPSEPATATTPQPAAGITAAEAARLRQRIAAQQDSIAELKAELQRIRNTLAPRTPRDD
ncbi:MAG TPA: hypothetical protein VF746_07180 [Longimicrobium sp.]|jgi:hypothetical protein